MKDLKGKVVALTGAGSGIGRCLSFALAAEGCRMAVADINEAGLAETAKTLADGGAEARSYRVDVSDKQRVRDWAAEVEKDFGGADVIVNNAGVVVADSLEDVSYEDFEWVMGINFWGVVYGTKEFLPLLRRRPEGHIVNISSINGMTGFPFNGPYNCSKFAVRSFNETLMMELRDSNIHITSVHPGGIRTNIVNSCRFKKQVTGDHQHFQQTFNKVSRMTPEHCAATIVKAIKKDKERLLVGLDAKFLDLMARLAPHGNIKGTAWVFDRVSK